MSKSTGKLKSLTLEEKMKLIQLVEDGRSVREVAEAHSINKNTLHYILKHREKIRDRLSQNPNISGSRKRIKDAKSPELEQRILEFMNQSREKNQKLSGSIIKEVALEIAYDIGVRNFAASNGWLFSFFKRNSITISEINKGLDPYQREVPIELQVEEVEAVEYEEAEDMKGNDFDNFEIGFVDEIDSVQTVEEFETLETLEEQADVETQESPWRNWCRLCGCIESSIDADLQNKQAIKQLLNVRSFKRESRYANNQFTFRFRLTTSASVKSATFQSLRSQKWH